MQINANNVIGEHNERLTIQTFAKYVGSNGEIHLGGLNKNRG